jgi:hypothetical protein
MARKIALPAVDRDRAVDESGNQIAARWRGARRFNLEEMQSFISGTDALYGARSIATAQGAAHKVPILRNNPIILNATEAFRKAVICI